MRPAGRGPLDSLYFRYPHFEAPAAPRGTRTAVTIVGAGPIGMTAALTLARYGIASVLIDRKSTFNDGSRAICIARASMTILDRIGAVGPFVEKALPWRRGRSYYRGRQIYRLEMPHSADDKFMPMYNLQQQYIEQFLWNAVARQPLIDARWQTEVTNVEVRADGVRLRVATPHGAYDLAADHVLAADGARSAVRAMLGLRLAGENYEGRYVIADVRMAHDFPTERRAFFEPASNPGGTVLIHKQPDDIWRIDYQLRTGEDEVDAVAEPTIRRRVQAILDEIGHSGPWELEWWSIYSANTLCLDDYRHGRVTFIGDSAHIVPIFGVRGLNNGLADAHNIGWKLAYVLTGVAPERLLDSYTPERRGATLDVFANAGRSARFMTPPTRGVALARQAALSLAVDHSFTRDLANPRQMTPHTYADSPLTTVDRIDGAPSAPPAGALAPDVALAHGGHLLDRAGDGFTLLLLDGATIEAATRAAALRLDPRFTVVEATGEDVLRRYGLPTGSAVLLRPDLHIAARLATPAGALDALARALGLETGS